LSAQVGDELELRIERIAAGGAGVGRTAQGLVVFVESAAPGDELCVRVSERFASYARAEIRELRAPGPGRSEPVCPYYGRCGGCSWQHLSAQAQREARIGILADALRGIGAAGSLPPIEWLASPDPLAYRARARVVIEGARVGFRARRSHDVVDVERCAVLDPPTQAALSALRSAPGSGKDELELRGFGERVLGLRASPDAFVQANGLLWSAWQELVAQAAGAGELAVELYAGIGFYTALLARSFRRVIAVEQGPAARDLAHNCAVEVHASSAEQFAQRRLGKLRPQLVLLNPPRRGAAAPVLRAMLAAAPQRIVYVSCDPATLARDVARLGGAYRIARAVVIDAMPQTHHVEALLQLERSGADRKPRTA
jgi:23S rRNA (uracil1939-C5)-methyltransferase